jgi:hypothetical protein
MVTTQRGKLMIHSARVAELGNSGDSRREGENYWGDESNNTHVFVDGRSGSTFVYNSFMHEDS